MAGYYNPQGIPMTAPSYGYQMGGVIPAQSYAPAPMIQPAPAAQTPYMIQVDGEMAARAWQMPANAAPGTVIPIWDVDGIHVYFKSTDGFGRLNPLRKGRVVFDEQPALPEGTSGAPAENSQYITKSDLDSFRNEIRQMMNGNRQNGSKGQGGPNRGGSENA